jgi:hypothetical protein
VEKTVAKFSNLAEAEKADREFYRKLTGQQRLGQSREFIGSLNSRGVDELLVQNNLTVARP